MDEKDPSMDLPPEIACIHRKWNVRSVAYRTLTTHFQKLHPSSEEWAIYKNVISNIAAESLPAIREQALEVVFQFVQKCDTAQKMPTQVIHSLLDTIPSNIKPGAKHLLEQIILQYVEIGCSREVIDELLRTALINQVANVSTTCIEVITKILSVFGPTSIDLTYVLETLPYLQDAEELGFRSAVKVLILEIYRWQGKESIKNVGQILNPTDLKDVMKKHENMKHITQLKPTRHVRNIAAGSIRSDNLSSDQETDLLKQINDDFFRKLESPEWTERRDALMELRKVLESSFRLRPDNYDPLLTALKKVIVEDQCVIVVGLAIASITGIAKGLRQLFSPYAVAICRVLLEKFVEKRQNITEQLREALDVLTKTTSFESLIKTINVFLGSKNPTIRFETIQLLSRMFKKTNKQTLRRAEFSVLYKSLVDCLHHGQLIIREKSFIALAVAFNIAGEGVIMPYLETLDPMFKMRIKNYNLEEDFEEKYNEIKYRNVAKKELKNEEKMNGRKQTTSDFNLKESKKLEKVISGYTSPTRGNFKTQAQNALALSPVRKRIKSMRKKDNQPIFNYNKVTKRWSSINSLVTMEKSNENTKSKNLIDNTVQLAPPLKEHRKKENVKKYPHRRPYTVQKKETSHILSKDKRKKKRISSYNKKEIPDTILKQVVQSSDGMGDNIVMNSTNPSNNPTKLPPEVLQVYKPFLEYSYKNESPKKREQIVKSSNIHLNALTFSQRIPKSTMEAIEMKNKIPSVSALENSDLSQPVQQSVQTLDTSRCGEGFIVLTENEVKKLLGLKRISAVSDDSCTILPDWTSKKNLFKRSYKIFQVSKGATDRETQTSLCAVESTIEIAPEGGAIDLTKTVDVIPTQTTGVSIEEKGTNPRCVKKYNRGTQWAQHMQAEILDTRSWSKREASSDWQGVDLQKVHQSPDKDKEAPLKMRSVVVKNIKYRRPSQKDIRRQWPESDKHPPGADHGSQRTMQINTFTVTRSSPVDNSKSKSGSLTSELTACAQGRRKTKHHQERKQNDVRKDNKRQKQPLSKSNDSEDRMSTNSKHIQKIKRKYTQEITVKNKETTTSTQNDISSRTLIRMKKIERTKHHSMTKDTSTIDESKPLEFTGYASHKSEISILSRHRKGRRTKRNSKFKYEKREDTSSGSCKEGCNFLPLVTKSLLSRQDERKKIQNNYARKKHYKYKSQRSDKKGKWSNNNETGQRKSELAIRSSRKCYSAKDKSHLNLDEDARELDPETKQMVINELLKVCDISHSTFQKMIRHKVSPGFFKLTLASSEDQDTSTDRSARYQHRACTIL